MKLTSAFNTRLLLSVVLLISCANLQSQEMTGRVPGAAGPPTKKAELPPRPILYFDGENLEGGGRELVIKGVYPDGRQLGTLTRGKIAGWSPDGMWFAFFADGKDGPDTVNLMNLQGVVKTIFTSGPGERIFSVGWQSIWAPEGKRIALILQHRDDFSVAVVSVADSHIISRHRLPSTAVQGPTYKLRWSPDGRKILLVSGTTLVVDTLAGTVKTIAEKPTPAEWSPGSDAVFYFDGLWKIEDFLLRKLGSGKSLKLMDKGRILASGLGQPVLIHGVLMTLSPSGSKLAIAGGSTKGRNGTVHVYDLTKTGVPTLDKPSARFESKNVIIST